MWCRTAQGEGSRCCEKMVCSPDLHVPDGLLPHGLIPFNYGSHPSPSMLTMSHGQIGTEPTWCVNLVLFLFLN